MSAIKKSSAFPEQKPKLFLTASPRFMEMKQFLKLGRAGEPGRGEREKKKAEKIKRKKEKEP